ncbi:hypothetical protein KPA96_19155 [Burkholderia cenocepacia]|uniref:hypothetical protein n=1 Tax=Burkholderia cenocepacia TaxID=95486 RepID=UPI002862BD8D|nr:hypothetical protein [Burkholderia cenocepacia]MDR8077776.1 hypothetical protein [Burkholderia cenocepacia]
MRETGFFIHVILILLLGSVVLPAAEAVDMSQYATVNAQSGRAYNAGRDMIFNVSGSNSSGKLDMVGSKVAITRAYLVPAVDFYRENLGGDTEGGKADNGFYDAAFLCTEVANISSQPLLITSMRLEVRNKGRLRFGPGSLGTCPDETVSHVSPDCMLQPGERKSWLLAKGFVIPGVVDFLKKETGEYIFDVHPKVTSNDYVIKRFNNFLRTVVGDKITLRVSVFELNYKPVLVGYFRMDEGDDLFATEPRVQRVDGKDELVFPLQHDAFLGEALSQMKSKARVMPGDICK